MRAWRRVDAVNRGGRSVRRFGMAAMMVASAFVPAVQGSPAGAVIGGIEVSHAFYPEFMHVPALGCGSTVIAENTLLTAAHCIDEGWVGLFLIRGKRVTEIAYHPRWNGDIFDGYDMAVVRLEPGATDGFPPIQVGSPWDRSFYAAGQPATIIGHGSTGDGGPNPTPELHAALTVLRSDSYMDDIYNPLFGADHWIESLHIGAGSSRQTVCYGDSGGPLLVDEDPAHETWHWIQVGIASFGKPRCVEAAAFTELSGPQLAWLGQEVPEIKPRWGTCFTNSGHVGYPMARYVSYYLPSGHQDGPYYWELSCNYGAPVDPPPDDPEPEPGEDFPLPPLCQQRPWLCEEP